MKLKLLLTGTLFALSSAAFAMPEKPDRCPSVASISAAGIEKNLHEFQERGWFLDARNKFDTNTMWRFGIGEIGRMSYDAALWRVTVYLHQIAKFRDGPLHYVDKDYDGYICWYETYKKLMVMAVTSNHSQQSMPSIIHKFKDAS